MVRLVIFISLVVSTAGGVGIEEQRKYKFSQGQIGSEVVKLLSKSLGDFSFFQHSQFETFDIYFDSTDEKLKRMGFSFRLRRARKGPGQFEYALQFKSEMQSARTIRTEVEFKDFSKQYIDNEPLVNVIDRFINQNGAQAQTRDQIFRWLQAKKDSSLPPLQELRALNLWSEDLAPRIVGKSQRTRFHVYIDKDHVKNQKLLLENSRKDRRFLDGFFLQSPKKIWLMEGSWDQAQFHAIDRPENPLSINELEIENKYRPREKGTQLLNEFEDLMKSTWQVSPATRSKYLQAADEVKR